MYLDCLPEEQLKSLKKERDYYKWLSENPNATALEKRNANWIRIHCDVFCEPQGNIKEEDLLPVTSAGLAKLMESLRY